MDLAELLTLLGVIAAVIFGVPAWLTYMQGRTRRDLRHRLGRFHSALAAELRKRRQQDGLPVERFAQAVSHHVSSEDIVEWEKTGSIPHQHLGRVLDILQISDWDYRALALDHLTNEEFMSHVEPGGQRGSVDKALVSARRTWCLASRYSNITIPVVAARSQSHSQFRVETSLNYTYLDNLTDRDSVVEIARLLSRLFPYSDVSLECSTGYPFSLKSRPSVILGGIGTPGNPNNEFALEVFEALGIEAIYSDMSLSYKSRIWHSELRRGVLTRDTGLFARVHSPMDPDARLFLVQGTHTRGVHGAAKAFSLSDIAMKNHALCQRVVGDRDFIAIFDVQIIGGDVVVPELDETAFFLL